MSLVPRYRSLSRVWVCHTALLLLALQLGSMAEDTSSFVTKDTVTTFYRDFPRVTVEPRYIAPLTALLCVMASKSTLDREAALTGPHTRVLVHVYVNPQAVAPLKDRMETLPVGSIIVKEKLGTDSKTGDIGGMIKRAAGYDPANGDWGVFLSKCAGRIRHRSVGQLHRLSQRWQARSHFQRLGSSREGTCLLRPYVR